MKKVMNVRECKKVSNYGKAVGKGLVQLRGIGLVVPAMGRSPNLKLSRLTTYLPL